MKLSTKIKLSESCKIHGGRFTKLYNTWRGMKKRCYQKSQDSYPRYGGRGITVYGEWKDNFGIFQTWAFNNGYIEGLTIDRINNDKGYSPDNCRFVTIGENTRNRECVKLDWNKARLIRGLYFSARYSQRVLAKKFGIALITLWSVINNRTWVDNGY